MYVSPYSALTNSMLSDDLKEALTYEQTVNEFGAMISKSERAKRIAQYEAAIERRKLHTKIRQNICPECEGKLTRGNKDKKNNYRRTWICNDCSSEFNI